MPESVYKIIELVGPSLASWQKPANAVVEKAKNNLREVPVAEVSELDMKIEEGKVSVYRAKVKISFKYLGE